MARNPDRSPLEIQGANVLRRSDTVAFIGIVLVLVGTLVSVAPHGRQLWQGRLASRWASLAFALGVALASIGFANLVLPSHAFPSSVTCVVDYDASFAGPRPGPVRT